MNRQPLWRLSVADCAGAAEQVAERLGTAFGVAAAVYTDARNGRVEVAVFLDRKPTPPELLLVESVVCALPRAAASSPQVQVHRVKREDWAESWKKHFKPIRIGQSLLIKPSWDRTRPAPGQAVVVLDPGLSFGTGQHPTTSFCLRQIARFHRLAAGRFLDVGTGSGILAIAAARLGGRGIVAIDNDPDAIRVARENARRNGVGDRIRFRVMDLAQLPARPRPPFDLVCANLTSDLLLAHRARLQGWLQPHGWLVLAGILVEQFADVRAAYEAAGLRLRRTTIQGEWQSALFAR